MEVFGFENILGESEVAELFTDAPEEKVEQETPPDEEKGKEEIDNNITEVSDVNELFSEPESVGNEENNEEKEGTKTKKAGSSPSTYSSIAKAFAEDGIFPDLDDDTISKIDSPESFREAVENLIKAELDERQKRIDAALNAGVEVSEILKYERTINYLQSIKPEAIAKEDAEGNNLRKLLIYQDFINRGYSQERAKKMIERSFNAGTDVDDAKEALKSNIEFFSDEYNNLMLDAKDKQEAEAKKTKELAEQLKKSILEDKNFFGELEIDKPTRQKVFDNISKPIYKDPDTGEYFTALQKYEADNHSEFMKNVGLIFTLTDGFKSLDKLIKGKVKKEVNKGIKSLESVINNTSRSSDGNIRFASGINEDPESFIGKGLKLDF